MNQLTFPSTYQNQSYYLTIQTTNGSFLELLSSKFRPMQKIRISEEIEDIISITYLPEKNCYLVLLQLRKLFENEEIKVQLICFSFSFTKKNQVRLFPSFVRNLQLPQK